MKIVKYILIWVWCFPQMLAGLLVKTVTKARKKDGYYEWDFLAGLSLGEYVFVDSKAIPRILNHEKGHTKQSYILGWFYLLIIGIPSMVWYWLFDDIRQAYGISYYWFYTERWADRLGGVKR